MKRTHSKQVEFSCHAPKAKAVFVADTFNSWKPNAAPLHNHQPNGKWTVTLPLPPGRYEYKFVVDGQWCCEHESQDCPKCVPNEFGTMNRGLEVK